MSASSSSSPIESNADGEADEDADQDAGTAVDLDPTTPGGKILDAAAQAAANGTDDELGEPSSGSLREYRERQANASEDADTESGTPGSLAEYRQTTGEDAPERKHLSFADLLRGGRRNE